MHELKKYLCVVRTYQLDILCDIYNDRFIVYETNNDPIASETFITTGNDNMEVDYFDSRKEFEAYQAYINMLEQTGSEYVIV